MTDDIAESNADRDKALKEHQERFPIAPSHRVVGSPMLAIAAVPREVGDLLRSQPALCATDGGRRLARDQDPLRIPET